MEINFDLGADKFQLSELKRQQNEELKPETDNIDKIDNADKIEQRDEQLKKVSEEFEALFIQQMFDEMRDAGFESELFDEGYGKDVFEDMYYEELAKITAQQSNLGLAEAIYEQLKQK